MDIKPKTITYVRTRKINPGLIDNKFDYGSEEISYGSWSDIPDGIDPDEAKKQLIEYVEATIQEQVEDLVMKLRSKSRNKHYYMGAITTAFNELMLTQNKSAEEITLAFEQFEKLLEAEMAKLEV